MPPNDAQALKGAINTHKGHFTRRAKAIQALLPLVKPDTPATRTALHDELGRLSAQYKALLELYDSLRQVDPEEAENAEQRVGQLDDDYQTLRLRVLKKLDTSQQQPEQPRRAQQEEGAGAVAARRPRADETLRPDKLTLDYTPAEFEDWKEKFRAFHSTSGFDVLAPNNQQAYLYACVDKGLAVKLRAVTDANTTIFDANGMMDILDEEFMHQYPLFTRRSNYFKAAQKQGQKCSDFITDLTQLGDQADLQDLRLDELMTFRILTGVRDEKLREKMMEVNAPTLDQVKAVVRQYEEYQASLTVVESAPVAQVKEVAGGQRRSGQPQQQQQKAIPGTGKCHSCGETGHWRRQCPKKKEDLSCTKCGRKGHVADVCMGGRRKDTQKSKSAQANTAQREASDTGTDWAEECCCRAETINAADSDVNALSRPTPTFLCEFSTLHKNQSRRIDFVMEVIPDTGATSTVISQRIVDKYKLPSVTSKDKLRAANGTGMRVTGNVSLKANYQGRTATIQAIVTDEMYNDILMSWHDLQALGVISSTFPEAVPDVQQVQQQVQEEAACEELRAEMLRKFPTLFSDKLEGRTLVGDPMVIHLDPKKNTTPKHVLTARQVPLHMRGKADELVDTLVGEGIIVPVNEPTEWISPGHFVPKPNGGVRLVTDYKRLNESVQRPVHPFPCTREILQNIDPASKFFAKMDAVQGYFQIPLDEESSRLTTFLVHSGRYRYTRAPMGLNASGDEWCRRSDVAFSGQEGTMKLVDDGLTQGSTLEELRGRLEKLFEVCQKHNITLSRKKFQIGSEVKFAGHLIGAKGVSPDPEKTKALKEFPRPKDLTALRSFLGLANQLGAFVPDLAHASGPLRVLMKKDIAYQWLEEQESSFQQVKTLLTSAAVVKPFDTQLKTELYTDASRLHGLGFMLLQREASGQHRLIRCGSRSLLPAESRYATIELECLAIQYAVQQCQFYLLGAEFRVITDHRPLLGIFAKDLHEIANPRLLRFREWLQTYTFTISWAAGKRHHMADALSRAPVFSPQEEDSEEVALCRAVSGQACGLQLFQTKCPDYKMLVDAVQSQPCLKSLPATHPALPFSNVWDRLSTIQRDGEEPVVVLDSHRIVVPQPARQRVLQALHRGHCGIAKTCQLASQLYFWPGMQNSIKQLTEQCRHCVERLPSLTQQPTLETVPVDRKLAYPMSDVGVDLFTANGMNYLVMVDRYSGFPFCKQMRNTNTSAVTSILLQWFADWGFPQRIRSDGGPQFRSEFGEFCHKFAITHELSSPHNPESNGLAESAVKNVKNLVIKCKAAKEDFALALLEWRNTPRSNGVSPAVLFLGRRQKSTLPGLESVYRPIPTDQIQKMASQKEQSASAGEQGNDARSRALPALKVGDRVLIQHHASKLWDKKAVIEAVRDGGRSYIVRSDNKEYIRNRIYLRPDTTVSLEAKRIDELKGHSSLKSDTVRKCRSVNCQLTTSSASRSFPPSTPSSPSPLPLPTSTGWEHQTQRMTTGTNNRWRLRLTTTSQEGSTSSRCTSPRCTSGLESSSPSSSGLPPCSRSIAVSANEGKGGKQGNTVCPIHCRETSVKAGSYSEGDGSPSTPICKRWRTESRPNGKLTVTSVSSRPRSTNTEHACKVTLARVDSKGLHSSEARLPSPTTPGSQRSMTWAQVVRNSMGVTKGQTEAGTRPCRCGRRRTPALAVGP